MNYSKKHLKHIWYKYCFSGGDFRTIGIFSHDRMALCQWDNQKENSLYRKCERKAKHYERK